MHLYFSGIGGSGLAPLAHIALDFGFQVSGSDISENENTESLKKRGVKIVIGQTGREIQQLHERESIYWFVYTSSLPKNHPELIFAQNSGIKFSKRDELINFVLKKSGLKLIGIAGTHGKTTTTAMLSWLFKELQIPVSYLIGSDISWGNNGFFSKESKYFLLEADEYDRNFLNYTPFAAILTSIDYDHPDTYATESEYFQAFSDFCSKSNILVAFEDDLSTIGLNKWAEADTDKEILLIKKGLGNKKNQFLDFLIPGLHNRQNAALVRNLVLHLASLNVSNSNFEQLKDSQKEWKEKIEQILATFPGTKRRMEQIRAGLYSDYAHHPKEIAATTQLATELNNEVVVVYQPHQNLRQQMIKDLYKDCFSKAKKVYWLPTFLTRENPDLQVLSPSDLIKYLDNPSLAEKAEMNEDLKNKIDEHLKQEDLVLCLGAGSIDSWIRENWSVKN